VADALRTSTAAGTAPTVISLGTPRAFIAQGKPDQILARLGLDGPGLARSARDALAAIADEMRDPTNPPASLPATAVSNDALD
jgi:deoxyxylulose-5-phosphate synthase